jgi:hypothetical protein
MISLPLGNEPQILLFYQELHPKLRPQESSNNNYFSPVTLTPAAFDGIRGKLTQ